MRRARNAFVLLAALALAAAAYPDGAVDPPQAIQSALPAASFGALALASRVPSLYYSTREEFRANGRISVLVESGGVWRTAGSVEMDEHLRSREVDLSPWRAQKALSVRLEVDAPSAAHLDALLVDGRAPTGLTGRLARKLAAADNDIIPVSEVGDTVFTFDVGNRPRLAIAARIEPAVIGTEPVRYPVDNTYRPVTADSSFYRYRLGSRPGSLTVDGSLRGESLGEPLFSESFPLGSGHPRSPTRGWVSDDGRSLFAALDVTADNTLDAGKDYGQLFVKSAAGVREFKVTTLQERWGRAGFEYTDLVGWEHKVYEMTIPLAELGAIGGAELELAFAAYGTMAALPAALEYGVDPNGVDPDRGVSGTSFTFTVEYWDSGGNAAPSRHDVWIDLDRDGQEDAASIAAPFGSGPRGWGLALLAVIGAALACAVMSRRLRRLALVVAVIAALGTSCKTVEKTTQEVYAMTGSGTWNQGVVFTASVPLVLDPGSYDFAFKFANSVGQPVVEGTAVGSHTLTID